MGGVFGVDTQHTRTMIMLGESPGAPPVPVGDGRRLLVPNAVHGSGAWGSVAAELLLRQPGTADPLRWAGDPWSPEFLAGLHRRLSAFLGYAAPTHHHGYEVCVCVPADAGTPGASAPAPAEITGRYQAAGLVDVTRVAPTDALLCQWLAEARPAGRVRVTVLVCGETWSAAGTYQVDASAGAPPTAARLDAPDWVAAGCAPWHAALLRHLTERLTGPVAPSRALPLTDALHEYAALLWTADPHIPVPWSGPLAEHLPIPVRLTRAELSGWPAVRTTVDAVVGLLDRSPGPTDLIVLGGVGGGWPFLADALRGRSRLWRSRLRELDLAAGAAAWPHWAERFLAGPSAPPPPAPPPEPPPARVPGPPAGPAVLWPTAPPEETLPPWQRH